MPASSAENLLITNRGYAQLSNNPVINSTEGCACIYEGVSSNRRGDWPPKTLKNANVCLGETD